MRLKVIRYSRQIIIICVGLGFLLLGCVNSTPPSVSQANSDHLSTNSESENSESEFRLSTTEVLNLAQGQMLPITAEAIFQEQVISLEIARTPRQQAIGLMHREDLPSNHGMLFTIDPPRQVHFWMRNVQFPLDMLFLRDGEVQAIAHNVPPCTTSTCPTYGPDNLVDQVIELKGGQAEALGISIGDTMSIRYLEEN